MKNILVIAPHFDDAEFGLGGYLSRSDHAVKSIVVVCCSEVRMVHQTAPVSVMERMDDALDAAKILGASLGFMDAGPKNGLLGMPFEKLVGKIEDAIEKYDPSDLFIPLPSCNQDHEATYKACLTALRPSRIKDCAVYAYEYPLINWGLGAEQTAIMGRIYLRMYEKNLDKKLKALACHKSMIAGRENTLSGQEGVKTLAHLRGLECGVMYAELVYLLRKII